MGHLEFASKSLDDFPSFFKETIEQKPLKQKR
jgi:hypothetical protein